MSDQHSGTGFLDLVKSGLAALFGVQSEKNRVRDFEKRKPGEFIFIGIVLVIVFIITIYSLVSAVIEP